MSENILVAVRAGDAFFAVNATFARVPAPGEHVLLWLSDAQRAQLGPAFGRSRATPAVVRETVLLQMNVERWSPPEMRDHIANLYANLYVDAITPDDWQTKMARWASGE